MPVTSEIATAVFSLLSMKLCDRGVLPSTGMPFNVEMPAAGSDKSCPAVEEMWRTSTASMRLRRQHPPVRGEESVQVCSHTVRLPSLWFLFSSPFFYEELVWKS